MIYLNKVHAVNHPLGDRVFCGPAAISAVTGLPAKGEVRTVINHFRRRKPTTGVLGMKNTEMHQVLGYYGFTLVPINATWTNLKDFVNYHCDNKVYLVNITNHYVITKNRMVIDNWERDGCDVDEHHSRRKRVRHAWAIVKKDQNGEI